MTIAHRRLMKVNVIVRCQANAANLTSAQDSFFLVFDLPRSFSSLDNLFVSSTYFLRPVVSKLSKFDLDLYFHKAWFSAPRFFKVCLHFRTCALIDFCYNHTHFFREALSVTFLTRLCCCRAVSYSFWYFCRPH